MRPGQTPPPSDWFTPRTDEAAVLSTLLLVASLAWTIIMFVVAATFDRCDEFGQCVLALNVFLLWLFPQVLAAIPSTIAAVWLYRQSLRGESTLPRIGFAALSLNVLISFAFLYYLTTLPFGFR